MFCRKCGYILDGLDSRRCPECGRPFDPADRRTFHSGSSGRRWVKRLVLVAAITDAGLARIVALRKLQLLILDGTRITDAGLTHLRGLPNLRDLGVWGTQVTDAGLIHLRSLHQLRTIYVAREQLSEGGRASWEAALPNVRVNERRFPFR